MPRIPRPYDAPDPSLSPARSIAQISEGVASRIGAAGSAMGKAAEAVGSAFGSIFERQDVIADATNAARAKLDWYKFDNEAWTGLEKSVGEDGTGWEKAADIYGKGREEISKRYPISDPKRAADLDIFFDKQVAERGFAAANAKQSQMGRYYRGLEEKEITGAVARLEENPSQDTLEALRGPLGELVESGRGLYNSNAQIEARKRQIEGALLMGQYKGLLKTDPEAANALMEKIRKGQYEIDRAPASGGRISDAGGGHSFVAASSGAKLRVSSRYADRFAGLVADLEAAGVTISPDESGGYANRNIAGTNVRSRHADGEAIDVNWNQNPRGGAGQISRHVSPETIRALAAKHGLKWGGDWKNPDPMHFEVDRNTSPQSGGGAVLRAGANGQIDPKAFASRMEAKVAASSLAGQVPEWGPQFGITTGAPSEWARFFTMLQQQESGHRVARVNADGSLQRFATTPRGEQSFGPGQFKPGEYGLKTWADVNDPEKVADAYIKVAEANKIQAYFGSVQRDEVNQHGKWYESTIAGSAPRPVSERGITAGMRAPGAVPSEIGEQPQGEAKLSPVQRGLNKLIQGSGVDTNMAPQVLRGLAGDNLDEPLVSVIPRETITRLAERYPEIGQIPDVDQITVEDALRFVEETSAKGGRSVMSSEDQFIPMGRLVGGQVFTVKSKHGEIKVPAEMVNALDKAAVRQLQGQAKEQMRIRQREGEGIVDDMVRKEILTLETQGKSHSEFDRRILEDVWRKNPKKLAEFDRKANIARAMHEVTADAANVPADILDERLDRLRERVVSEYGDADPTAQAALDRAERRLKALAQVRERDPARAVREAAEVKAVREKIPGGEPKNKAHLYQIADATLKAQVRLGLPQVPISRSEARTIMADVIHAPEREKRKVAESTAQRVIETYGNLAERVMASAMKLTSGDTTDDDDMLTGALRRVRRGAGGAGEVDKAVRGAAPKGDRQAPATPNFFDPYE